MKKELIEFTESYFNDKFVPKLPYVCLRHRRGKYRGHVVDNCSVESLNSALARDPLGPKQSYQLHVSGAATIEHTKERFRKLRVDAHRFVIRFAIRFANDLFAQLRKLKVFILVSAVPLSSILLPFCAIAQLRKKCSVPTLQELWRGRMRLNWRRWLDPCLALWWTQPIPLWCVSLRHRNTTLQWMSLRH